MDLFKNSGHFSLTINGDGLDFSEIEKQVGIEADVKTRKGKIISKFRPALTYDVIVFSKKINVGDSPNEIINSFTSYLLSRSVDFSELAKKGDVFLRWYINTDYAQIDYSFEANTMEKFGLLGIDFVISIFSFGQEGEE